MLQSVTPDMRLQLQRFGNVYERFKYLRRYCKPSTVEWKSVLQDRITRLCHPDPNSDLIAWADSWIMMGQDALEAQVPGINAVSLRDTFLHCAAKLDYAFAAANNHIPESDPAGNQHSLHSVIRGWHMLRRQSEAFGSDNSGTPSYQSSVSFNTSAKPMDHKPASEETKSP